MRCTVSLGRFLLTTKHKKKFQISSNSNWSLIYYYFYYHGGFALLSLVVQLLFFGFLMAMFHLVATSEIIIHVRAIQIILVHTLYLLLLFFSCVIAFCHCLCYSLRHSLRNCFWPEHLKGERDGSFGETDWEASNWRISSADLSLASEASAGGFILIMIFIIIILIKIIMIMMRRRKSRDYKE